MRRMTVIGNVVKDAEVKDVGVKKAINFTIVHNEKWKSKNGESQEKAYYYNCVIWRDSNVNVAKYITKGTKLYIEGLPEVEIYKDGSEEIVGAIKINISEIQFLGKGSGNVLNVPSSGSSASNSSNPHRIGSDDLPF